MKIATLVNEGWLINRLKSIEPVGNYVELSENLSSGLPIHIKTQRPIDALNWFFVKTKAEIIDVNAIGGLDAEKEYVYVHIGQIIDTINSHGGLMIEQSVSLDTSVPLIDEPEQPESYGNW